MSSQASSIPSGNDPYKMVLSNLKADMNAAKKVNQDVSKKHISDGKTSVVAKEIRSEKEWQKDLKSQEKKHEKELKKYKKEVKDFEKDCHKAAKATQTVKDRLNKKSSESEEAEKPKKTTEKKATKKSEKATGLLGLSKEETKEESGTEARSRSASGVSLSEYMRSHGVSFDVDKYNQTLKGDSESNTDIDGDSDDDYHFTKKDYKSSKKKYVEVGETKKPAKGSVDTSNISFSKAKKNLEKNLKFKIQAEEGVFIPSEKSEKSQKKSASKATKGALLTFETLQKDLVKVNEAKTNLIESRKQLKGIFKLEVKDSFKNALKHLFSVIINLIKSRIEVKKLEKKEKALEKRIKKLEPEALEQNKKVEANRTKSEMWLEIHQLEAEILRIKGINRENRGYLFDLNRLYARAYDQGNEEDTVYYGDLCSKMDDLIGSTEKLMHIYVDRIADLETILDKIILAEQAAKAEKAEKEAVKA